MDWLIDWLDINTFASQHVIWYYGFLLWDKPKQGIARRNRGIEPATIQSDKSLAAEARMFQSQFSLDLTQTPRVLDSQVKEVRCLIPDVHSLTAVILLTCSLTATGLNSFTLIASRESVSGMARAQEDRQPHPHTHTKTTPHTHTHLHTHTRAWQKPKPLRNHAVDRNQVAGPDSRACWPSPSGLRQYGSLDTAVETGDAASTVWLGSLLRRWLAHSVGELCAIRT